MTLLGRLLGKHPPLVPAGGRAFVSQDDYAGTQWSVRVQMAGYEPSVACKRLGPVFGSLVEANRYLEWVEGGVEFRYPEGRA